MESPAPEAACDVVDRLFAAMQRVREHHVFGKGVGLAAPQIGIDRAAATEASSSVASGAAPVPKACQQDLVAASRLQIGDSAALRQAVAGRYFEDCNEAHIVHDSSGWIEGVAPGPSTLPTPCASGTYPCPCSPLPQPERPRKLIIM